MSSVADVTESWEFRSALEAPIATLESLDEIDRQVKKSFLHFSLSNRKTDKLNFLLWFEVKSGLKIVVECDLHFSTIRIFNFQFFPIFQFYTTFDRF